MTTYPGRCLGVASVVFITLLVGCTTLDSVPETSGTGRVALSFVSNRRGKTEPCGCSMAPQGGVVREANLLRQWRHKSPGLIHLTGGTSFIEKSIDDPDNANKAELVVKALNGLKLSAFSPSSMDLSLGRQKLSDLKGDSNFPWVGTNIYYNGSRVWDSHVVLRREGMTVVVLSAATPQSSGGFEVREPVAELQEVLAKISKEKRIVVLLSSLDANARDQVIAKLPEIDFVLGGRDQSTNSLMQLARKTLYANPNDEGRQVIKVELENRWPLSQFYVGELASSTDFQISFWEDRKDEISKELASAKKTRKREIQAAITRWDDLIKSRSQVVLAPDHTTTEVWQDSITLDSTYD